MTAGWTEDRVGALKKLWLEGQSASQIAKQLGGGVTRNAVIGKVHRLGLWVAPHRRSLPAPPSAPPVRGPPPRPSHRHRAASRQPSCGRTFRCRRRPSVRRKCPAPPR